MAAIDPTLGTTTKGLAPSDNINDVGSMNPAMSGTLSSENVPSENYNLMLVGAIGLAIYGGLVYVLPTVPIISNITTFGKNTSVKVGAAIWAAGYLGIAGYYVTKKASNDKVYENTFPGMNPTNTPIPGTLISLMNMGSTAKSGGTIRQVSFY